MEWVNDPEEHEDDAPLVVSPPDATAEDAAIAGIARRLNPDERKVFLGAVARVRKEAGKGQVRIREPNADEKLILDAYIRHNYVAKDTAEALGVDLNRVYYVTRAFEVRPVELRHPALKNPSEHMLRFMRQMYGDGYAMKDIAEAVKELCNLSYTPNYYTMQTLAAKAGIDLRRPKFDKRLYPDLVDDFDAISEKYGFAVGTLHQHYMRAKKAQKGLPT